MGTCLLTSLEAWLDGLSSDLSSQVSLQMGMQADNLHTAMMPSQAAWGMHVGGGVSGQWQDH